LGANNELNNLAVVRTILRVLGKEEDFIDFIADRPGHDLRYAIDPTKANSQLGWFARSLDFENAIAKLATSA
jgi:dTDP-glucose 4,6-dehydratase